MAIYEAPPRARADRHLQPVLLRRGSRCARARGILKRQPLPPELVGKKIWDERFADITHFEDYLTRQGTIVLKFILNLSREEQKRRFLQRFERPEKNWKSSASDVHERKFWDDYMHAFEEAVRATASKQTPWRYAALKSQRREAFWPSCRS